MAKRRRNPDGSLVTPLSAAQLASLAKGRAALAARVAGAKESEPVDKGATGRGGGRKVETVRLGAKANAAGAKARPARKASSARKRPAGSRAKAPKPETKASGGGLVDRAIEWFGRGE